MNECVLISKNFLNKIQDENKKLKKTIAEITDDKSKSILQIKSKIIVPIDMFNKMFAATINKPNNIPLEIECVKQRNPETIITWTDGTETIVSTNPYSKKNGVYKAIAKKMYANNKSNNLNELSELFDMEDK